MSEQEVNRAIILDGLAPLFEEAEKTGKWFFCAYQDIWFSARELREQHVNGSFFWGAVNWELRDPRERLHELQRNLDELSREIDEFSLQIIKSMEDTIIKSMEGIA